MWHAANVLVWSARRKHEPSLEHGPPVLATGSSGRLSKRGSALISPRAACDILRAGNRRSLLRGSHSPRKGRVWPWFSTFAPEAPAGRTVLAVLISDLQGCRKRRLRKCRKRVCEGWSI